MVEVYRCVERVKEQLAELPLSLRNSACSSSCSRQLPCQRAPRHKVDLMISVKLRWTIWLTKVRL